MSWATDALDLVRRTGGWNSARRDGQTALSREPAGRPLRVVEEPREPHQQTAGQAGLDPDTNKPLYRAYLLKEQLRQVFAPGGAERIQLLDHWLHWAARCRIDSFVDLARRMRRYRDDIANTLTHNLANARVESVNTQIRLLERIAYGFKSAQPLITLAMLHLGGYRPTLPGRLTHQPPNHRTDHRPARTHEEPVNVMIGDIWRGLRHGQLLDGVRPSWSGPSLPATWRPCVRTLRPNLRDQEVVARNPRVAATNLLITEPRGGAGGAATNLHARKH